MNFPVSVAPMHLFRYIDERVFTFNTRDLNDFGRFALVLHIVTPTRTTVPLARRREGGRK